MKRRIAILMATLAALAALAVACGGGDDNEAAETPAVTSPAASETHMAGSPASTEELTAAFETARTNLRKLIDAANAGDLDAARDAYEPADDPLHMIEDSLADVDSSLADSIESKQHGDIEDPLDSSNPDLTAIASAAEDILNLLDEAATKLNISAQGNTTASAEDLAADLATLKTVMEETKAKADAGDVAGTQEAEGKGDDAIETLIDALRSANSPLADQLENLELDYEHQADSANPVLTVISQDAQDVLDLLDQVAAALNITS